MAGWLRTTMGRRGFLATAGAGLAMTGLDSTSVFAAGTQARPPAAGPRRVDYAMPTLTFDDPDTQRLLGPVYEAALTDLVGINTVYADPATYDGAGLLSYPPGTFVRAGGGYPEPQRWTRDAAVNAWNAASLLGPLVARNTLLAMVDRRSDGSLIVQQDNQWWDQVVWIVGAWHHYLVTGDRSFLAEVYPVSAHTLAARAAANRDAAHGLFQGPSFMNDGIAGYPAPPWEPGVDSSFVLDYPASATLLCLSTNCLYHGAYLAAADMAEELGRPTDATAHRAAAANLRQAINRYLWRPDAGNYGYFVHGADASAGQLDTSQEGAGLAFAVLLGVADPDRTRLLLDNAHWEPHGIVNSWPTFARFSDQQPGRHNVSIWPMVHAMFGHAAAAGGRVDLFARALTQLAQLVSASGDGFYEVYNAKTGAVDGGWQTDGSGRLTHWTSEPDQTWSATGFLRMVYYGLFGLRFSPTGVDFAPTLPPGWGPVQLSGLPYRDATVDITVLGAGNRVTACEIDGRPARPTLPGDSTGPHNVRITLSDK
jgi:glycogen debranching enzyme